MASRARVSKSLIVMALVFVAAVGGVLLLRHARHQRDLEDTDRKTRAANLGPKVFVAAVKATPPTRDVTLPAEVRAFFLSTLYAKIPGYMKEIRVDKGDTVTKGEVLATIESPETDMQLLGARTDLIVKQQLHTRLRGLLPGKYVAPQEVDDAQSTVDLARSVLDRLKVIQRYEVVTAPFSGLITGRYVDPGAMIPAPISATESAMPIVDIAALDRVRIAVYVGQDISGYVGAGTAVTVVPNDPSRPPIEATVTRTAGAVDPRSRMMLCEIWLDNREHILQPGTFVRTTLHLKPPPVATIPSEALFVRNNVDLAAVVDARRVAFVHVKQGLDDGVHVEVLSGLEVGQTVALNLPADIEDGGPIQPVPESERQHPNPQSAP